MSMHFQYASAGRVKALVTAMLLLALGAGMMPDALATEYVRVYSASANKYVYVPKKSVGARVSEKARNAWRNPVVKKGVIGAGVGLGTAALTDGGLLKGGLVGAGVGAGWGAMDRSKTMQRKPLLRHVSKGALAGAGVGAAAGGIGTIPAAMVGAGAGAVTHYVKTH